MAIYEGGLGRLGKSGMGGSLIAGDEGLCWIIVHGPKVPGYVAADGEGLPTYPRPI